LSVGACDGCGELYVGEVHEIREGLCPGCGAPLRPATDNERRSYVIRRPEEPGEPLGGWPAGGGGGDEGG
jgi:hypothetical protein